MPMLSQLRLAAAVIKAGGIVAYPTEFCFGLGCDPRNHSALINLLKIKKRNYNKGLILIASTFRQLQPYLGHIERPIADRIGATWPGPETWILPSRPGLSRLLTGQHQGIAVRVTAHPVAAALCRYSRSALTSTSANLFGQEPLRDARSVQARFADSVDFIVDAAVGKEKKSSRIRNARSGACLRH